MASDNSKIETVGDIYAAAGLDDKTVQNALQSGGQALTQSISDAFQQKTGMSPDQIKTAEQQKLFYQTAAEVIKAGSGQSAGASAPDNSPAVNIAATVPQESDTGIAQAAQPKPQPQAQPVQQTPPQQPVQIQAAANAPNQSQPQQNLGASQSPGISTQSQWPQLSAMQASIDAEYQAKQDALNQQRAAQQAQNQQIEAQNKALADAAAEMNKKEGYERYALINSADIPTFQKDWQAKNASTGITGDIWRNLKQGTLDIVDVVPGLYKAMGGTTPTYDQWSNEAHEKLDAELTPESREAAQKSWASFGADSAWWSPRAYIGTAARSLPSTLLLLIPGSTMGQAAFRSASAIGINAARAEAVEALAKPGFTAAAEKLLGKEAYQAAAAQGKDALAKAYTDAYVSSQAPKIAQLATEKAGNAVFRGSAVANGIFTAGNTATGITQALSQVPDSTWKQSDLVKGLMASGMSFEDAKASVTKSATFQGSLLSGLAGGVFGGAGDRVLAKIITHEAGATANKEAQQALWKRLAGAAAHGIAAEGGEESAQEASQQLAQNYAVSKADNNQSLTEGVPNAALGGFAGGAFMGAGFGMGGVALGGPLQHAVHNADMAERARIEAENSGAPQDNAANPPAPAAAEPVAAEQNQAQAPQGGASEIPQESAPEAAVQNPAPEATPQEKAEETPKRGAKAEQGKTGGKVFIDDGKNKPWQGEVTGREGNMLEIADENGEVHKVKSDYVRAPLEGETLADFAHPESVGSRRETYAQYGDKATAENLKQVYQDKDAYKNVIPTRSQSVSLADLQGRGQPVPEAGARVIADAPAIDVKRQGGEIVSLSGEGAHKKAQVKLDSGETKEFPIKSLYVARAAVPKETGLTREVSAYNGKMLPQGARTLKFPDESHAQLYDLGANTVPESDREQVKNDLAKHFGTTPEDVVKAARTYADKGGKYAADTQDDMNIAMPVLPKATFKAATSPKQGKPAEAAPKIATEAENTAPESTIKLASEISAPGEENLSADEQKQANKLADDIVKTITDEAEKEAPEGKIQPASEISAAGEENLSADEKEQANELADKIVSNILEGETPNAESGRGEENSHPAREESGGENSQSPGAEAGENPVSDQHEREKSTRNGQSQPAGGAASAAGEGGNRESGNESGGANEAGSGKTAESDAAKLAATTGTVDPVKAREAIGEMWEVMPQKDRRHFIDLAGIIGRNEKQPWSSFSPIIKDRLVEVFMRYHKSVRPMVKNALDKLAKKEAGAPAASAPAKAEEEESANQKDKFLRETPREKIKKYPFFKGYLEDSSQKTPARRSVLRQLEDKSGDSKETYGEFLTRQIEERGYRPFVEMFIGGMSGRIHRQELLSPDGKEYYHIKGSHLFAAIKYAFEHKQGTLENRLARLSPRNRQKLLNSHASPQQLNRDISYFEPAQRKAIEADLGKLEKGKLSLPKEKSPEEKSSDKNYQELLQDYKKKSHDLYDVNAILEPGSRVITSPEEKRKAREALPAIKKAAQEAEEKLKQTEAKQDGLTKSISGLSPEEAHAKLKEMRRNTLNEVNENDRKASSGSTKANEFSILREKVMRGERRLANIDKLLRGLPAEKAPAPENLEKKYQEKLKSGAFESKDPFGFGAAAEDAQRKLNNMSDEELKERLEKAPSQPLPLSKEEKEAASSYNWKEFGTKHSKSGISAAENKERAERTFKEFEKINDELLSSIPEGERPRKGFFGDKEKKAFADKLTAKQLRLLRERHEFGTLIERSQIPYAGKFARDIDMIDNETLHQQPGDIVSEAMIPPSPDKKKSGIADYAGTMRIWNMLPREDKAGLTEFFRDKFIPADLTQEDFGKRNSDGQKLAEKIVEHLNEPITISNSGHYRSGHAPTDAAIDRALKALPGYQKSQKELADLDRLYDEAKREFFASGKSAAAGKKLDELSDETEKKREEIYNRFSKPAWAAAQKELDEKLDAAREERLAKKKKTQPKPETPAAEAEKPATAPKKPGFFDRPGMEDLKAEAEDLFEQLRKKLFNPNQLNSGFDPDVVMLAARIAGVYIRGGIRKFADFVKAAHQTAPDVVDKLGRGNMRGAYLYARHADEFEPFRGEMDNEAAVEKIDYDSLIKEARAEESAETAAPETNSVLPKDYQAKLDKIIDEEGLNPEKANKIMQLSIDNGKLMVHDSLQEIRDMMPPLSMRKKDGSEQSPYEAARNRVVAKLQNLLDMALAAQWQQSETEHGSRSGTDRSGNLSSVAETGRGTLEGIPAEEIRGSEKERQAEEGAAGGNEEYEPGDNGPEGNGLLTSGRMGNGEREISVSAGRAGSERAGSARTAGERKVAEKARAARPAGGEPATSQPESYTVTKETAIEAENAGKKTKFKNNIAAIKVLETLANEDRPATAEEQAVLARWSGWGGLREAFPREDGSVAPGWEKQAKILRDSLTKEEYNAARESVLNAHYTPAQVVESMWDIADRLGFAGGRVLEPAVGSGVFIGGMPANKRRGSHVTGVEIDPITGNIAKNLYPGADINVMGFQDVSVPAGHFDMVIGNPPFGSETVFDPNRKDLNGLSIHNYFFAKSVDGLRPGGVAAFVITNSFLDGANEKTRRMLGQKADLVGAIRLPNNAFAKNAGTQVTTDIVLLRRRAEGEKPGNTNWLETGTHTDKNGREVPLNKYFIDNPDMMLGDFGAYGHMYGREGYPALIAREGENLDESLQKAIDKLPRNIMPEPGKIPKQAPDEPAVNVKTTPVNSIFVGREGGIWRRLPDELGKPKSVKVEYRINGKPSAALEARARGMLGVRDIFARLRAAQLDPKATDEQVERLRDRLNAVYDSFTEKNGPVSSKANEKVMSDDPTYFQLLALENNFKKGVTSAQSKRTGEAISAPSAQKSDIFFKRTQWPYKEPTSAKTAKDALAIALMKTGRVDFDVMGSLLNADRDSIIDELGDRIYKNPDGSYETSDAYLSGNVRRKLAEAERAYDAGDTDMERNIAALKAAVPEDISAENIKVRPGASWLPPEDMQDFVHHITGTSQPEVVYNPYMVQWNIKNFSSKPETEARWGTQRAGLGRILGAVINDRYTTIYKDITGEDGKPARAVDVEATAAAAVKADQMRREFESWIWSDADRQERLTRLYNDMFNNVRLRHYDGSHLTFPGKVSDSVIELRPHQKNFVWRALQHGCNLADHQVGAGKTFAAIAATMERRRMGLARKPMIIVPNHLVSQWGADFLRLYPGANLLVASKKDLSTKNRQTFLSRIANGDYDAIIMAHSSFGSISVSDEFEAHFIENELEKLRRALAMEKDQHGEGRPRTTSKMVKRETAYKNRLKQISDNAGKDKGLTFMDLGVDSLTVDEAHEFKNLAYTTSMLNVAGLPSPNGSKKAFDLYMKSRYLLEQTGGKNLDFLTGTPISNSLAEAWTMQRYLDGHWLEEAGLDNLDGWVRQFAEVRKDWELSPNGIFKQKSRLAKFNNMPELMQRYLGFADVITSDDIKAQLAAQGKTLPIPKVEGGKPQNVVVERSPFQADFIGVPDEDNNYSPNSLIYRFDHLGSKPMAGGDNALSLTGLAAKVALDPRIIDRDAPDFPGSKVNTAARNIKAIYDASAADKGTQLVFCDLSTPKGDVASEKKRIIKILREAAKGNDDAQTELDNLSQADIEALFNREEVAQYFGGEEDTDEEGGSDKNEVEGEEEEGKKKKYTLAVEMKREKANNFSVYDDLKHKLAMSGIPENEIAFIHDAKTDEEKGILFGKVRSGQVRVLIGSTSKMGAGTNVQNRIVALHHLDAPWRPSDLEQREGRAIRQGNELYEQDPENFAVKILRYATKQTLDARRWQVIESKARFIQQFRKGDLNAREVDDISGEASNAAEMKAASSGDPRLLQILELDKRVNDLRTQHNAHIFEQAGIVRRIGALKRDVAASEKILPDLEKDAAAAAKVPEKFSVTVKDEKYDNRGKAAAAILAQGVKMLVAHEPERTIGNYGPLTLKVARTPGTAMSMQLVLEGRLAHTIEIGSPYAENAAGLISRRLVNRPASIIKRLETAKADIANKKTSIDALEKQQGKKWDGEQELADTEKQLEAVRDAVNQSRKRKGSVAAEGENAGNMVSGDDLRQELKKGPLGDFVSRLEENGRLQFESARNGEQASEENGVVRMSQAPKGKAQGVLLHEEFHAGTKPLIGDKSWSHLIDELTSLYHQFRNGKGDAKSFFGRAIDRVRHAERTHGVMSDALRAEEFGAYAIEELENAPRAAKSWAANMLGHVKAWARRRFGVQLGKLTPEELRALAIAALKDHAQQTETADMAGRRKYSVKGEPDEAEEEQAKRKEQNRAEAQFLDLRRQDWNGEISDEQADKFGQDWDKLSDDERQEKLNRLGMKNEDSNYWAEQSWKDINGNPSPDNPREALILNRPYDERELARRAEAEPSRLHTQIGADEFDRPYLAGNKILEEAANIAPGTSRVIGKAGELEMSLSGHKSGGRNVVDLKMTAPDGKSSSIHLGDVSEPDVTRAKRTGARAQKLANSLLTPDEEKASQQDVSQAVEAQINTNIADLDGRIAKEKLRKNPDAAAIAKWQDKINAYQTQIALIQRERAAQEAEVQERLGIPGKTSGPRSQEDIQAQKDAEAMAALREGKTPPGETPEGAVSDLTKQLINAALPKSKGGLHKFIKQAQPEMRRLHDVIETYYGVLGDPKAANKENIRQKIEALEEARDKLRLQLKKADDAIHGVKRDYSKFEKEIAENRAVRLTKAEMDRRAEEAAATKQKRILAARADEIEKKAREAEKARREALTTERQMKEMGAEFSGADKDSRVRGFLNRLKGKITDFTPAVLKTIPLNYFIELAQSNMTAVADYLKAKRQMDTYRTQKHDAMNKIALRWQRLGRFGDDKMETLSNLMHESTTEGIDPTKTIDELNEERLRRPVADANSYLNRDVDPVAYERIKAMYDGLPKEMQDMYREVRDAYAEQERESESIIMDNVVRQQEYIEDRNAMRLRRELDAIMRSDMSDAEKDKQAAALKAVYFSEMRDARNSLKGRLMGLEQKFNQTRQRGPYFPLKRFGDYFVTVRDDREHIISFSRRETAAERDELAKEMEKTFPNAQVQKGVLEAKTVHDRLIDPAMMAELEEILGKNFVNDETSKQIMDMLWQKHLESLPDLSIRKSFIHRKATAGFAADALRNFGNHMFHAYHQMGRMKYEITMHEMLFHKAVEQARQAADPTKATMLINEMKQRHDWVMNPRGSDWANKATSAGFVWYLGATPAAAIVNMMQTLQMGIPILGAHFNSMPRAAVQMMKAGLQAFRRGGLENANLSPDEMRAMKAFYASGLIDRTQSHELAGIGDKGANYGYKDKAWAAVMKAISFPFHRAEVWNRETTALAAYRMARMQGESHETAMDMAHDLTWRTHFDYSNSVRPPIMQSDFAKVALLFKNYQLNMIYRLGRDLHQSFFGLTPQARRMARRELAGIMGMFSLLAGVAGVPGYNLMMGLMGSVFGDKNDPYDYELRVKQDIYNMLGPELGGLVVNGVPGHLTGTNWTDRIGMADLLFRSDDKDESASDAYQNWFTDNFGGPVYSMGATLIKGFQMMKEGNTARGVEMMLPNKALRDGMRAFRYNNEGLMTQRNDEILSRNDFDYWDIAAQAMGFTPAKVSEAWERNIALKNAEGRIKDERQELINRYAMAVKMKDPEAQQEILAKIREFNQVPRNRPVAITGKSLALSLQTRRKQDAKRREGVLIQNPQLGAALRKDLIAPIYK